MSGQWYSYDPENGFKHHDTAEAARKAAMATIELCLDEHWAENTDQVEWGRVYERATETNVRPDPSGNCDYHCDYELVPVGGRKMSDTVGHYCAVARKHGEVTIDDDWTIHNCDGRWVLHYEDHIDDPVAVLGQDGKGVVIERAWTDMQDMVPEEIPVMAVTVLCALIQGAHK